MRRRRLQSGRNAPLRVEAALLFAVACVAAGGCASPIEGREQQGHVGRSIQPIVGGTVSGTDQDSVVVLARFENGVRASLCTATLIAPNLLLTARHCVSSTDATAGCGSDGQPVAGALLHGDRAPETLAMFASTGGVAPDTATDTGAAAHGKALVVDDATSICNHDLAFVILDKAARAPVAQIRLAAPAHGDTLTAVGFGLTEAGHLPLARMQRSGLALVGAGPMAYPDDARYGAGDAEFLVGESACSGDSGSPALMPSGAVVGVASRAGNGAPHDPNNAAATCLGAAAHAVYARLGANPAFAQRAFKEAGATPWLEGQPDPRAVPISPEPSRSGASGAPSAASQRHMPAPSASEPGALAVPVDEPSARDGGGCSASGEPICGSVEHALGIIAVALLVLRLRSARRRRDAGAVDGSKPSSDRVPYVDLGMRESFASLSDDR